MLNRLPDPVSKLDVVIKKLWTTSTGYVYVFISQAISADKLTLTN
jgi:hypothetical protein